MTGCSELEVTAIAIPGIILSSNVRFSGDQTQDLIPLSSSLTLVWTPERWVNFPGCGVDDISPDGPCCFLWSGALGRGCLVHVRQLRLRST